MTNRPSNRQAYFDHQAGTPLLPEALEAMKPFFIESFGSPSSLHRHGMRARDAVAGARRQIAELINAASPEEILFTSDGTEAANLAVKGAAYANRRRGDHIVTTGIEHPSVLDSLQFLETQGFQGTRVGVDSGGRVDPEAIGAAVTNRTILISVHLANHDIGTIQPVARIGEIAAEKGIAFHVDAEAAAGWLPLDAQALGANLISFSPHRFYGPKGVGVLYRNRRARLHPILHGGVQEDGKRAGTENVPGIVGAGVAAEAAQRDLDERIAHTARLQNKLWDGIKAAIPYVRLNGPVPGPDRLSTNLNISAEFIEGEGQILLLDTQGVAVAGGTGCISKSLQPSHVLRGIGLDHALAQAAIILSLGKDNTDEDAAYFLDRFSMAVERLRSLSPVWDEFQRGVISSVVGSR